MFGSIIEDFGVAPWSKKAENSSFEILEINWNLQLLKRSWINNLL